MVDREFSWLEGVCHEECLRNWLMSQCLGISVGQLGWEWSPVAEERDEAPGGDRETIHSVDSAFIVE